VKIRTSGVCGTKLTVWCLLALSLVAPSFAEKKINSVAVTVGDPNNQFFVIMAEGARAAAKDINPNVKFTAVSSNYDVNNQAKQINEFVASGVNLILLNAADSEGIAPSIMRAKTAGVVVVAVGVGAEAGVDATVTLNNKEAGKSDAEFVGTQLMVKGGNVVIVNGPPVTAIAERTAGFLEEVKKYSNITILSQDQNAGGSRDAGIRVMTNLLTAFPKIDAVFAINDATAIGCAVAAKQAQRNNLFIVGVDGSPDVLPFLLRRIT
jgi:ribose transport system substrate-binding protein